MDNKNGKVTIGFHYVNEFGDDFKNESTVEVFYSLGDTELSVIGNHMNNFLRQIGFFRRNENIFMDSLTDEEYDAVAEFIENYRGERTETVQGDNT